MTELNSFIQLQEIYKFLRKRREDQKFLNYLEISATFVLISIFLFFAIKPTATTIFSLLGDIKSKQLLTSQMKSKIISIVQAQDAYSQVQEKYDVIESSLPDKPKYYQSALNFSSIAQQSSNTLDQINFNLSSNEKSSISPNINTYSIDITSKTNYQSTLDFVKSALNNRRLVDLKSIQLSKVEDKNGNPLNQLRMNITANLFYLKDNNEKK